MRGLLWLTLLITLKISKLHPCCRRLSARHRFLWPKPTLHGYITLPLNYPPADGHSFLHFFATLNLTAMNSHLQAIVEIHVFHFSWVYVETRNCRVIWLIPCLTSWGTVGLFSKEWLHRFTFLPAIYYDPSFSTFLPVCVTVYFF